MESNNLPELAVRSHAAAAVPRAAPEAAEFPVQGPPLGELIKRYAAAVFRYKWLVLLCLLLGISAGFLASRHVPLQYRAEATLWVEVPDRATEMHGPIQSAQLLKDFAWVELLKSYAVLDPVVTDLSLYLTHDPRDGAVMAGFALDSTYATGTFRLRVDSAGRTASLLDGDGSLLEQRPVGSSFGGSVGFIWQPAPAALDAGREVRFSVTHPRTAAEIVQRQLDATLARGGNFLRVGYTSTDPAKSADVVNATVRRFVSLAADLKRARLVELRDTLDTQLEYARALLESAELELERFRVTTITLPSEAATPVNPGTEATRASAISNYFDLKVQKDQLERDYQALERAVEGMGTVLPIETLNGIAAVRQSPEASRLLQDAAAKRAALRSLRQQYTDEHRLIVAAVEELRALEGPVAQGVVRELIEEIGSRIAVMDAFVGSAATDLRGIPPRAIEEARLRRAVGSSERLYNDLRQRFENARLATETSTADVSLLTPAREPQLPVADIRLRIIFMATMGGLGLGVAGALLRERLDHRIRYPEEVSDGLRLTILGAVPDMDRRDVRRRKPGAWQLLESMRGIRLNLSNAYGTAGPIVVTVTSPGTGDGKSFVTTHLAKAFANSGRRTLLIDGDARRGTLHRLFGVDRRPGLIDYLSGRSELAPCVRSTGFERLDLLPFGMRHSEAPELLASHRLGQLLASVKQEYEVILIDSPPLGAGVDPLILGSLAGNVLLVVRAGRTERGLADAKLEILDQLPLRVLGAVMNGIGRESPYRYYSYLAGYETGDEEYTDDARLLAGPVHT
jgi:polysaccharide biosynthesis transport protein